MILTDSFSKVRVASVFSMTPQQAIAELGIKSTQSLEGDRDLLKGLLRKYHPDVAKTEDAPVKMKAVNVLWETFIRQGKPIDVHARQRETRGPIYEDPSAGPADDGGLSEWLELHVADFAKMIAKIQGQLERLIGDIHQRGKGKKPEWQVENAITYLGGMYNLIKESGFFDSATGNPEKQQMSEVRHYLYKVLLRLKNVVKNWDQGGALKHRLKNWGQRQPDNTIPDLQYCIELLQETVDKHDIFTEYTTRWW